MMLQGGLSKNTPGFPQKDTNPRVVLGILYVCFVIQTKYIRYDDNSHRNQSPQETKGLT